MNGRFEGFDALLSEGLTELRSHLKERVRTGRVSHDHAKDLVPLIQDLNFPGLMMFLAKGTRPKGPSARMKTQTAGISNSVAVKAALNRIPGVGPLKPTEIRQATQLVLSGEFRGDIADATAAILHLVPQLPVAVVRDVHVLPRLPLRVVIAIKRDLIETPAQIRAVKDDLLDNGKLDSQPVILTHTLGALFRQAAPYQVAQTVHTLLGNHTVRLAIIVVARSEGILITDKELDAVRAALDPHDPDLGALIVPAFERFGKELGVRKAMALFERFVA